MTCAIRQSESKQTQTYCKTQTIRDSEHTFVLFSVLHHQPRQKKHAVFIFLVLGVSFFPFSFSFFFLFLLYFLLLCVRAHSLVYFFSPLESLLSYSSEITSHLLSFAVRAHQI
jgi:hypothetical protein